MMDRRVFLAGSAGAVLAGCRSGRAIIERSPQVRVYIAGRNPVSFLPAFVANNAGLFLTAGANVSFRDGGVDGDPVEALASGAAEVSAGLYEDVLRAVASGKQFTAFALMTRSPLLAIAAPASGGRVQNIEDLLQVRTAMPELQSSEHLFLNYNYFQEGGEPVDLRIVEVGYGSPLINALINRTAAAAVAGSITIRHMMKELGGLNIIADTRTVAGVLATYGVASYPGAALFTTPQWLQANPKEARKLATALAHGCEWIRAHSPEQVLQTIPGSRRGSDPAIMLDAIREAVPLFSEDGLIPNDGAREALKAVELTVEAVRKARIDVTATYTNAFAPARSKASR
jgi:NitT/TauT family transport system substrate-binding protein